MDAAAPGGHGDGRRRARHDKHTIPSLLSDPDVVGIFRELRRVGWKDWHLLNVVANLTINHRLALRHGVITAAPTSPMADACRAEALRAEEPDDPQIAADQITRNVMEEGIRLVAVTSLHRWGLALHHSATDSDAIMQLVADRYRFWDDDIAHPDPFHGRLVAEKLAGRGNSKIELLAPLFPIDAGWGMSSGVIK